jgi:hypothetical protein
VIWFTFQVLTVLPEYKIIDDTKDSEASIYKSLWIEAEASACKLKYELQLARMKLATMKAHNTPKGGNRDVNYYIQILLGLSICSKYSYSEIYIFFSMQFLTHRKAVKAPTHP